MDERRELPRVLERLGYRYMGMTGGLQGWAKNDAGLVLTVAEVRSSANSRLFRIAVQNEQGSQIVALDELRATQIIGRMVQYECALLNGIESLRQDL